MLDKVVVVLSTEWNQKRPKNIEFNTAGKAYLGRERNQGYILRASGGYIASRFIYFNGNKAARKLLARQIPNARSLRKSRYSHAENFIPCGYRLWMKNEVSMAEVRNQIISELFTVLEATREAMADQLSIAYDYQFPISEIRMSIRYCEICFDQKHPQTTQICRIPKVIKGFNLAADDAEVGYFRKDGAFRARTCLSLVGRQISFSKKDAIRAHINEGGAWVEHFSYQKEDGEYGALNRCESRFDQKALEVLLKSRLFSNENYFIEKIDRLAEISFNRFHPILNFAPNNRPKQWPRLRKVLRTVIANCAEEVFTLLRKNGRISTANESNRTPKSARRRIPVLAKYRIIFRKKKGSTYEIDWASLPFSGERYFRLKQEQGRNKTVDTKPQKFQQRVKSWANIKCD